MIYRLSLIVALFFISSCDNKKATQEEAVQVENILERYPNGLKKIEGKLVNGQRQGKWVVYYENGLKWSEGVFVGGVRQGDAIVYYENGKKKLEGKYRDNKKVGIWKVWEMDGTLVETVNVDSLMNPKDSSLIKMPDKN